MHTNAQQLAYGIADACKVVSIGRSKLYQEIKDGKLKTFKLHGRTLIAADDLEAWLNSYRSM